MSTSRFLIAQISDLHIRAGRALAYKKVDTATALETCVQRLNTMTPRPDLVLITGDLGDQGIDEEYAILRDILGELTLPYAIIPGNHDGRMPMHRAFPQAAPLNEDGFIQYSLDDGPLRLVGLDSLNEGELTGGLCDKRLAWLDRTLAAQPEKPTLLFIHHPPFKTGIEFMDSHRLVQGADGLAEVIAKHKNLRGMICGHLHRPIHTIWAGIPVSCVPAPAHQVNLDMDSGDRANFVMEPAAFHLHRWTDESGLVTHMVYVNDHGPASPFFEPDGALIL